MLIDNITDEARKQTEEEYPATCMLYDSTLTRDEVIKLITQEYVYWKTCESHEAQIYAAGALANIIARISMNYKP